MGQRMLVRQPTASVGSMQATTDAVDNSAAFAIRTDPLIVRGKLFRQTEPLLHRDFQ